MFFDKANVDTKDYVCMILLLNVTREAGYMMPYSTLVSQMTPLVEEFELSQRLEKLGDGSLLQFSSAEDLPAYELKKDGSVGLTFRGMAFLVNYANEYIEQINKGYGDVPENLVATLVPFLELSAVPAADRYVKTTDNLPAFKELERQLKIISDEIRKDLNADELPIPNKRAVLSDIDGALSQIRDGFVRLSDITSRIRPLVKNLAEWCKDLAIIVGAATAAWLAVQNILQSLH
jgi:hypothetical protein